VGTVGALPENELSVTLVIVPTRIVLAYAVLVHAVAKSIIPAALRCLVALIFSLRSLNSAPEENLPELSYKGKGPWNAGVQHKVIFLSGKYRCKFINLITIRTANLSHTSLLVKHTTFVLIDGA